MPDSQDFLNCARRDAQAVVSCAQPVRHGAHRGCVYASRLFPAGFAHAFSFDCSEVEHHLRDLAPPHRAPRPLPSGAPPLQRRFVKRIHRHLEFARSKLLPFSVTSTLTFESTTHLTEPNTFISPTPYAPLRAPWKERQWPHLESDFDHRLPPRRNTPVQYRAPTTGRAPCGDLQGHRYEGREPLHSRT